MILYTWRLRMDFTGYCSWRSRDSRIQLKRVKNANNTCYISKLQKNYWDSTMRRFILFFQKEKKIKIKVLKGKSWITWNCLRLLSLDLPLEQSNRFEKWSKTPIFSPCAKICTTEIFLGIQIRTQKYLKSFWFWNGTQVSRVEGVCSTFISKTLLDILYF